MAEYIAKDTALTAVADAIREKAGSSDPLAFPAGFVEAIAGISAGGGLPFEGATSFASGAFTPAEDVCNVEISHNLGRVPVGAMFVLSNGKLNYATNTKIMVMAVTSLSGTFLVSKDTSTSMQALLYNHTSVTTEDKSSTSAWTTVGYGATEEKFHFGVGTEGGHESLTYKFYGGRTYVWFVW